MSRTIPAARAALLLALALASFAPVASASSPNPRQAKQADIASLSPVLQGAISAAVGERDPLYRMQAEGEGYRARNARHALDASVGAEGMAIAAGGGQWRMSLTGWARGAIAQPAGTLATKASGNRVEVERGGVTEWWVNGPVGLQQGWTIASRPFPGHEGALELVMRQSGSLRARGGAERSLEVADAQRRVVLHYGGLTAFDATGRELPARFEVSSDEVRVRVEDAGAVYPVLVDPIAQQAYLKASNTGAEDEFGYSVAISGDTVVVGAYAEDSNATGVNGDQSNFSALDSGAAYVFVRSGGLWTQQAYLKASNTGAGDQFGISVAISGDTIVVGAYTEDSNATGVNGNQADNSALDSGAAYVFVRSGGLWTQQAYLKASNTGTFEQFGYSVAISGDTIVVGAIWESSNATGVGGNQADNSATYAGAAYVFVRSGGLWTQQAYLKASNTGAGDNFGNSVAISGDTVVVGARFEASIATGVNGNGADNSADRSGAAYVFVRNGGLWTQQAYLKASNTGADDNFGWSVAISGDTIVVGAYQEDSNATGVGGNQADNSAYLAGAAYVFVRSGTTWTQQAYLKASNTGAFDQFGYSVAISGDTIVVGAYGESSNATGVGGNQANNSVIYAGAAYVFVRRGGLWTQQAYLKASNTGGDDRFGSSVAISGGTVVVGARYEASIATGVNGNGADNSAMSSGAAYVFNTPAYTVTPSAGPNGTISPARPQTVLEGTSTAFAVTPNTGYEANVGGSCGGKLVGNTYTTNAITAACTVAASFTLNTYTVTPSAGPNGTISPSTPQTIAHGSITAFTVTPAAGYTASVGGTCGGSLVGNTYTTNAITAACTVVASFNPITYTVTPSAGPNGTIFPATPQTISRGNRATFALTPAAGYTASVGGTCGGSLVGNTYTTNAITANCTVVASFTLNTYAVTPSAGPNGTIFPATPQTISRGNRATFALTPAAGYTASVGGTCGGTLVGNTYTTNAVTANCTVVASFTRNTLALTVTKSGGGAGLVTSTPSGIDCGATCSANFNSGASVALGAAPSAGSFFNGWSGSGCTGTGACNVTMDAVKSVGAEFKLNTSIPRLANISTRMQVLTGNDVLIGGFVIGGSQNKTVVVRARGPSLIPFGITNALPNPTMQLFSGQTVLETSDDWGTASNAVDITASGFAPSSPLESAILTTLGPGAYTAVVSGVGGFTGVGIIEVFEVDKPEVPLVNISTRGQVLTGGDVMIGGFIIQGDSPQTVTVRARGPSLVPFGITNALLDPVLQLFNGSTLVATNDDWQVQALPGDLAAIQNSGFAPADTREAVIRMTLPPGAYTAIVSGKGGTTGVGIIEAFAQ